MMEALHGHIDYLGSILCSTCAARCGEPHEAAPILTCAMVCTQGHPAPHRQFQPHIRYERDKSRYARNARIASSTRWKVTKAMPGNDSSMASSLSCCKHNYLLHLNSCLLSAPEGNGTFMLRVKKCHVECNFNSS